MLNKIFAIALLLTTSLPAIAGERIVSLKPNITEILFALGSGSEVVGVTRWCDRPKEVEQLPKVADYINIDTEKIIALKPSLVIGSRENSRKEQFAALESAGIRTIFLPFQNTEELFSSTQKIADALGKSTKGKELVARMKKEIAKAKLPDNTKRSALILVGHRPLVAASDKTFLGELLNLSGASNMIEGESIPYPTISNEQILAKKPDVIFDLGMGSETRGALPKNISAKIVHLKISDFRAGPEIGKAVGLLSDTLNNVKQR